jgi:glycosyltransferase involved in cell wall biosynthesis
MYNNEKVNVIMPVYNEEKTLSEIISRVLAQDFVDSLIIIDDCSKDGSMEKIKEAASSNKKVTYLSNEKNMGKGYSVRRGLELVTDGIVIIQDADLEYYPEDYQKLLPRLDESTVVLGTRMRGKQTGHEYAMAKLANAGLTVAFNVLYGRNLTDMNTCFKVFKKKMLENIELKENGFLIEPEILIKLVKKGYKIVEIDIRYKGRTYEEGKKITAKDGINQALFILRQKFSN